MRKPRLAGVLDGLTVLGPSDAARYKAAVEAGRQMGWGYYFAYLLSRNRPGRSAVLAAEDEGSMCVFLWRTRQSGPRLDLYLAPAPMNVAVLRRCLERANDFNGDFSARILRIDTKDVDAASSVRHLRIRQRKQQYLYDPRSYADISGRKYYTIRRNVSFIERLPDVEVLPYSTAYANACNELLRRWRRHYHDAHGSAGGVGTSLRAIELAGILSYPELKGEVVFVNGRIAAFAFGGEIRPGLGCILDTKSDNDVRGLSYFHRRSLLLNMQEFELVNDGSDTGRAGLRQLKDSFRPVVMHTEHRGFQREVA